LPWALRTRIDETAIIDSTGVFRMEFLRRRRAFITLVGGAVTWPLVANAQQGERMRRIGVFTNLAADDPESQVRIGAFLQGLQQSGWAIGSNVRIDYRWGTSDIDRARLATWPAPTGSMAPTNRSLRERAV
jgi:hypothetical protein